MPHYDALLFVSFGGPNGPDDVIPFLENVLCGRNVPRERMLEVAEHYYHFGGKSPINEQNQALITALREELKQHGPELPIYWGNRNWQPMLTDTMQQMRDDGVEHALAFVTSVFSSYSGCRQYREDIEQARQQVGANAPQVDKLRVFFNHPGFIEPMVERVQTALEQITPARRERAEVLFTAHSIPQSMADTSAYVEQLEESCRLVSERAGLTRQRLLYQSRSGPPSQPWLEPDVCDFIEQLAEGADPPPVVVVPIGFISDHMEVLFDLDTEAAELCQAKGIEFARAGTVGTHRRFVTMIRELIEERMAVEPTRLALGTMGPNHDLCPTDCCFYQPRRPAT